MDRFERNYLAVLLCALAIGFVWYWSKQDARVDEINELLASDLTLRDYPFPFRVLSLDKGVAVMNSPRSAEVPTMRFLRIAYPALGRTSVDHPDMMAAQDELATVQAYAAERVREQADVSAVRWQIDERWFREHGVFLNLD